MEGIFLSILNMSFTGGIVIVLLLAARLLMKRAPKKYAYALWGIALLRLLIPFSFESIVSLLPVNAAPIPENIALMQTPRVTTGVQVIDNSVNPFLPAATPHASVNPMQVYMLLAQVVWLLGVLVLAAYSVVSLIQLNRKLVGAVFLRDNIWMADGIQSPFVMGLIRPKIYLPSTLTEREREYILLHEQTHIKRGDHIVRALSFAALCLHWFNPLVWLAFHLSGKDMEMSCDESVMRSFGEDIRAEYSASLLHLATGRRIFSATPLAFGEGDTKARIKNTLRYRKPAVWVACVSVALIAVLAVCLLTNPVQATQTPSIPDGTIPQGAYQATKVVYSSMFNSYIYFEGEPLPAFFSNNDILYRTNGDGIWYEVGTLTPIDLSEREFADLFLTSAGVEPLSMHHSMLFYWKVDSPVGSYTPAIIMQSGDGTLYIGTGSPAEHPAGLDVRYMFCVEADESISWINTASTAAQVVTAPAPTMRPTPEPLRFTDEDEALEVALSGAILAHNAGRFSNDDVGIEAHTTLGKETDGNLTTVYAKVLYQEYTLYDGGFENVGGGNNAVAITLERASDGSFAVTEYWEPSDGDKYGDSILEKFPARWSADAMDTQKFISKQMMACYMQVVDLCDMDVPAKVDELLQALCASQAAVSEVFTQREMWGETNNTEYRELLYYSNYTVRLCEERIAQGGNTASEERVMNALIADITAILGET